jgi:hypothetical protein
MHAECIWVVHIRECWEEGAGKLDGVGMPRQTIPDLELPSGNKGTLNNKILWGLSISDLVTSGIISRDILSALK